MTTDMTTDTDAARLAETLRQATQLFRTGRFAHARILYERILETDPRHAAALHQLGVIAGRSQDFERAAQLLGRLVEIAPDSAAAANDLGVALKGLGRYEQALSSYDRAIALKPDHAEAHNNRGNVLRQLGRYEAALASYDRAIAAAPGYAEAHGNRGVLLNDLNRWEAALSSHDRALALRPGYANAYCNRGVSLEHLGRLAAALDSYDCAISLDRTLAQAYVNRGNVLRQMQRPDEAVVSCNHALALRPDDPDAHLNRGLALLAKGDFAQGWREYEWRWRSGATPLLEARRTFAAPLWLGREPLSGKTLLIHCEQGLGDTLQFCRYVPLVAQLGASVVLEVPPPLASLLADLNGVSRLVVQGGSLPAFDYHCPLLSLPLAFDTTLSSIPRAIPYLRARRERLAFWSHLLGPRIRPRVGLVWSGGFRPDQPESWSINARRNIPLRLLAPLHHPGIDFISLQKGEPAASELSELIAASWQGPPLADFTDLIKDFSDTAALIDQLDLVISVDTSTAHLAGALGKPVWLLDRFDTCWRWLLGRVDSPWYPTARLYRQDAPGEWHPVVDRVRADLIRLVG